MKILSKTNTRSRLSDSYSWKLIIFLIFGLSIFSLNSLLEVNYFVRNYLIILEIQSSIVLVYFTNIKLKKLKRNKQYLEN
ncbi:hypothetical protein [Geminocystis sp. NIES-3709]|uniref:hypothetical protein n=1 Tax=Geminocystis sp. NIES-3709 TaxID=1617448 RepID=UPI000826E80A|nr:hypothetical protein [Geminocystis sp. NIES-3709]